MNFKDIKNVAAKRTPGQWRAIQSPQTHGVWCEKHNIADMDSKRDFSLGMTSCSHNVEFVAMAANNIDKLIAAVEVLEHAMELGYFSDGGSTAAWAKQVLSDINEGGND